MAALVLLASVSVGCNSDSNGDSGATDVSLTPRSFAMGFTDFPHERSLAALNDVFSVISLDADMAVMHFDDGVPWQEALAGAINGTDYTQDYAAEFIGGIDLKKTLIPIGHVVYLAVTPINFLRNGLADHRGMVGNEPLTAPWDGYVLDHPDVIKAFLAHCENMITAFSPDYFAYAIEANILYANDPAKWLRFVKLAEETYTAIKATHPNLPVFITLQVSFIHADWANQTTAIDQILPYTDFIAVSAYHYSIESDPDKLAPDFFTAVAGLAPNKPFVVAETAWPAEDVTAPYPAFIPADTVAQQKYIKRLLQDADKLSAEFVTLFFTRDYDDFWQAELSALPEAPLLRLWKDTGLYDGLGNARPALDTWRAVLARPRR